MPPTTSEFVKPGLVRAWFDTVLNPLIWSLRTEANLLDRGDFTLRTNVEDFGGKPLFVSLVPVREHITTDARDNLDQFLTVYPEIKVTIDDHDQKLHVLYERVSAYYTALVELPELHEILRPLPGGDAIAPYVAEYVVNNITQLPYFYANYGLYKTRGPEFLALRERDEVVPYWSSARTAQEEFRSAVDVLVTALTNLRGELSFALDVPIVESVAR